MARRWMPHLAGTLPWTWFIVRDVHAWTDIVAAGLPMAFAGYALTLAVLWFPQRPRAFLPTIVSTLLAAAFAIAGPWFPQSQPAPVGPVRILTANVESANGGASEITASIIEEDADVVVVTELSSRVTKGLSAHYEYRVLTDGLLSSVAYGRFVGVFANRPIEIDLTRRDVDAGGGLRVVVGGTEDADPFVIYALHLPPLRMRSDQEGATPATQRLIVDGLLARAADEEQPIVMVGDFNAPDRGRSFRALTDEFRDASRGSWAGPTSRRPAKGWVGLLLRIDHVLIPQTWCASDSGQIPLPTSDHVGVVATVGPCPEDAHQPAR